MISFSQRSCVLMFVLFTTTSCNSTDDRAPLEPNDAELQEAIEQYCDIVVPCYPGMWEEPANDACVSQQGEWAARSPECRKASFDFLECITELGSCEALAGQPCRIESNIFSELRCDAP